MFQPTLPAHTASLMHMSDFERRAATQTGDEHVGHTRLAGLSPTLLQDLQRRDPNAASGLDLLQVLAAALRHSRALQLHLELDYHVIPLSVWPQQRELRSPLTLTQLLALRLPDLRVLRVEPAAPGGVPAASPYGEPHCDPPQNAPLGVVLWELALRGARGALLPEIAGPAAYRVAPGADLEGLALEGTLATAVDRLRRDIAPLRDIATWPGFDRDRAARLLNGLYLQAALMVSRSHPMALG